MDEEVLRLPVLPASMRSRYSVRRTIGSGGTASVYQAHDEWLDREVAVKVFDPRASHPADRRAQRVEARTIARLNHHALTTLFDVHVDETEEEPRLCLVMEYIPGRDLRQRLQDGPLTAAQACWLGFDLSDGLAYLHEAGLVHHDVKPSNVLLADRRADSRIRGKLADFGITALAGQGDPGEYVLGTAAYLSPEQVEGTGAIPASDVYSLGLVLLEAVTGRVAYPGSVEEAAFARLQVQPSVPDAVPPRLAEVLRAMVARYPEDRPEPDALASRFQELLVRDLLLRHAPAAPVPARRGA